MGMAYTLWTDRPAMIMGFNILWPGVAQSWAISSDAIRGYGLYATRVAKSLMIAIAIENQIRRYHCIVNAQLQENVRWVEALRYQLEGVMHEAAPDGSDLYIYVKWFRHLGGQNGRWAVSTKNRLQRDVAELFGMDA
jgi:hypothetical protein